MTVVKSRLNKMANTYKKVSAMTNENVIEFYGEEKEYFLTMWFDKMVKNFGEFLTLEAIKAVKK